MGFQLALPAGQCCERSHRRKTPHTLLLMLRPQDRREQRATGATAGQASMAPRARTDQLPQFHPLLPVSALDLPHRLQSILLETQLPLGPRPLPDGLPSMGEGCKDPDSKNEVCFLKTTLFRVAPRKAFAQSPCVSVGVSVLPKSSEAKRLGSRQQLLRRSPTPWHWNVRVRGAGRGCPNLNTDKPHTPAPQASRPLRCERGRLLLLPSHECSSSSPPGTHA